jgi:hypothetical protein
MKILQRSRKVCPNCLAQDVRPSRRRWLDYMLLVFLIFPYRCRICGERFWRFA